MAKSQGERWLIPEKPVMFNGEKTYQTRLTPWAFVAPSDYQIRGVRQASLAKFLIEPRTATALVGHGLRQEGLTVSGAVHHQIMQSAWEQWAVSMANVERVV